MKIEFKQTMQKSTSKYQVKGLCDRYENKSIQQYDTFFVA